MSEQAHNNQSLVPYLLGSLPAAETERFDELSLTDGEFADLLKATEKDLVDAYVQGELTGAELEQFKSHYLASAIRRERVQFAQALQTWADRGAAVAQGADDETETTRQAETKLKPPKTFTVFSLFRIPRRALQWGAAFALLALLIAGGWLAFENIRLRRELSQAQTQRAAPRAREQELQKEIESLRSGNAQTAEELARVREERARLEQELEQAKQQRLAEQQRASTQPQPSVSGGIASFTLTPQVRGLGEIQPITVPAKTDSVAMRLQLEPNDFSAYQVSLLTLSGNQTLWRSTRLKAKTAGGTSTLSISFRASLLKPQTYLLRVNGIQAGGASEIFSDYPFRVVK